MTFSKKKQNVCKSLMLNCHHIKQRTFLKQNDWQEKSLGDIFQWKHKNYRRGSKLQTLGFHVKSVQNMNCEMYARPSINKTTPWGHTIQIRTSVWSNSPRAMGNTHLLILSETHLEGGECNSVRLLIWRKQLQALIQPKQDQWEGSMSGSSFKGAGNAQMLEGFGQNSPWTPNDAVNRPAFI